MNSESIKNLNLVFRSLPEPIKNWLTSREVSDKLSVIVSQFNLKEEQELALSRLILSLVTQHSSPESFTNEMVSELVIDKTVAKEISKNIGEKILKPIANDLLIVGVDIKLLELNAPPSLASIKSSPPSSPTKLKQQLSSKPFVLHEEKSVQANPITPTSPSFIFKDSPTNNKVLEPAKVTIERVVHYSNFYTPLNQASLKYHKRVQIPKSKWFI